MEEKYISFMNKCISSLVWDAVRIAWRYPAYLTSFFRLALYQSGAEKLRSKHAEQGIPVPAFMIISITRRCNLTCRGCYSHATLEREKKEGRGTELDSQNLKRVVREGTSLGVSFMLIAGGEPLVRADDLFALAEDNPSVIFPVFTNGILIDDKIVSLFKKHRNVIPVLSIEGGDILTDQRRGKGVYERAHQKMKSLKKNSIFFGVSFTVMKQNLSEVISNEIVKVLCGEGVGLFFYNEYTPVEDGTTEYCISAQQRSAMLSTIEQRRKEHKRLFIAFPGEEDLFGGCLSAGRGFVHVAPDGRLEACPFAPFGDTSSATQSLSEALKSPTLSVIRKHHDQLHETAGGCALWDKREWVEGLLNNR